MIDYLKNAFPTQQMRVFATSDGSLRSEPMRDEAGDMVECAEAIAARDALIEELCAMRSEEHTSELQSLMRISYAVFCLKKKNTNTQQTLQQHKNTNKETHISTVDIK